SGEMSCLSVVRTDLRSHLGVTPNATPSGYGPTDLANAYKIPSGGSGATVAIVDAQDDPNAEQDLATYRNQYGLPACTTANGCFRKVNQSGGTSYPRVNSGWAQAISLDPDMVPAVCPGCHILLVESSSTGFAKLAAAEAVADPNTGVSVYDSCGYVWGSSKCNSRGARLWQVFSGTSVAAPIVASVYALAGNASTLSYGSYPYAHASSLFDVTSGNNSSAG